MIPRRRLLATTLLAAAAAGVPVRAAAQPSLPADPDGTIPDTLNALPRCARSALRAGAVTLIRSQARSWPAAVPGSWNRAFPSATSR